MACASVTRGEVQFRRLAGQLAQAPINGGGLCWVSREGKGDRMPPNVDELSPDWEN